jgi:Flp pilus assembly protein TadB
MLDKIVRGYNGLINTIIVLLLLPIVGMATFLFGVYWIIYFPIWRWKWNRDRRNRKVQK